LINRYEYEEQGDYDDDEETYKYEDGDDVSQPTSVKDFKALDVPVDSYVIKSWDDIVPYMKNLKADLNSLLALDDDESQLLLQNQLWSKEVLIEKYLTNKDKLYEESGLTFYETTKKIASKCVPPVAFIPFSFPEVDTLDINGNDDADTKVEGKCDEGSSSSPKRNSGASSPRSPRSPRSPKSPRKKGDAKAAAPAPASASASASASSPEHCAPFKCAICYDEHDDLQNAFSLGCSHKFCYDCCSEYISREVAEGPRCIRVTCPEHLCNEIIPRSVIMKLVNKKSLEKYDLYVKRNFVESNKKYRYCSGVGCEKVFVGSGVTNVVCTCLNQFCFKCGDDAHEPASCDQLEIWNVKNASESETANWILVNTKKCPKCSQRIDKNDGCNHMTCKMCKHDFCWICLDKWSEHGQHTGGYYKCNKYQGAEKPASDEKEKAKAELERYLHYYQRYHNHNHSLKLASKARLNAEKRMAISQDVNHSSWVEVQFLKDVVEQVITCRRLLKYTYVLGFFLKDKSSEKELFEYHQEMLEKNTERLHELTEMDITTIDRTEVINLTRVTERFVINLQECMHGGIIQSSDSAYDSSASAKNLGDIKK
jgi:ariadne-1